MSGLKIYLAVVLLGLLLWFGGRWAYAVYYVDTHCTMVLGTRVCR